ncbi:TRAP-type C4-dicarboxylate transport system permease small subunit [Tamaricihabitans halophyticus]|uniref:TRAP-type C4-dicarboxylate transport system permease small subunit n=1 Tax=Tamaricihabitans halophyticus TaxID=1262583 RepID=A0A4R2Q642_9PSEU|nr:TRAP transporter small permease [Tamaricihabitans halophyticus]TCP43434.1 TRAP-type C4-dicarboxylate transport system permease small subunit [Tamaricihabitans halophyticus]
MSAAATAGVTAARDRLVRGIAWLAGTAFGVIFVVNIAQIVARQVSGGWTWVGDLNQLLFSWMIMLGAAAAYGKHDHIAASFLVERVPARWQRGFAYLVRGIELSIGFVLLVSGWYVTLTRMEIPYIQLGVPTGLAFLAIPALGALVLLFGLSTRPHIPTTLEQADGHEAVDTTGSAIQQPGNSGDNGRNLT